MPTIIRHHQLYQHHIENDPHHTHQITTHYQHHNQHEAKTQQHDDTHGGTHPEKKSRHSGNKVSNPNVTHNHHVLQTHEVHHPSPSAHKGSIVHHPSPSAHKTYIHHESGKQQPSKHNPNQLPKSPISKKPKPITPTTPTTKPTTPKTLQPNTPNTTGTPNTTVNPKPKPTTHVPIDIGIGNPPPGYHRPGSNVPAEGSAYTISAVNSKGKVPSSSNIMQEHNPQVNVYDTTHSIIRNVATAWANLGVWENNTFTNQPKMKYYTPSDVQNYLGI